MAIVLQLKLNLFSYVWHITNRQSFDPSCSHHLDFFFYYILRIPLLKKNGKVDLIQSFPLSNKIPVINKIIVHLFSLCVKPQMHTQFWFNNFWEFWKIHSFHICQVLLWGRNKYHEEVSSGKWLKELHIFSYFN